MRAAATFHAKKARFPRGVSKMVTPRQQVRGVVRSHNRAGFSIAESSTTIHRAAFDGYNVHFRALQGCCSRRAMQLSLEGCVPRPSSVGFRGPKRKQVQQVKQTCNGSSYASRVTLPNRSQEKTPFFEYFRNSFPEISWKKSVRITIGPSSGA